MSVDAQKKKGSRKKRVLLIAGVILLIIVGAVGAIGMPWIRWYIDGSNPDTPVAAPTDGVETNAFDFDTRTVLQAWYPLGGRGNTSTYLTDETVNAIAEAHGKSAAQIILRWHLQDGHIAIPGSHNPDHIRENTELFDFELTDEEMAGLRALNLNEAYFTMIGQTSDDTQEKYGAESSDMQEDTKQ